MACPRTVLVMLMTGGIYQSLVKVVLVKAGLMDGDYDFVCWLYEG